MAKTPRQTDYSTWADADLAFIGHMSGEAYREIIRRWIGDADGKAKTCKKAATNPTFDRGENLWTMRTSRTTATANATAP